MSSVHPLFIGTGLAFGTVGYSGIQYSIGIDILLGMALKYFMAQNYRSNRNLRASWPGETMVSHVTAAQQGLFKQVDSGDG
jgi:hypothetical protein